MNEKKKQREIKRLEAMRARRVNELAQLEARIETLKNTPTEFTSHDEKLKAFEDRRIEILKKRDAGMTYVELAKEYGITPSAVRSMVERQRVIERRKK